MRYAKVVEKTIGTIKGDEIYYAFKTAKSKKHNGMICGHYKTRQEAEAAAKLYRAGEAAEKLVVAQTKKMMVF